MALVAQSRTQFADTPVFYSPPPTNEVNIFAAWMTGFLNTRNEWAMEVFRARLAALDPTEKAKLMLKAQKLEDDARAKILNAQVTAAQTKGSMARAVLTAAVAISKQRTDASMKNATISGALAGRATSFTSDQGKILREEIGIAVQELAKLTAISKETGNQQDLLDARAAHKAVRLILSRDAPGKLDILEQSLLDREVRIQMQNSMPAEDAKEWISQLPLGPDLKVEVQRAGTPGIGGVLSELQGALEGAGLAGPDITTSTRTSTRGPVAPIALPQENITGGAQRALPQPQTVSGVAPTTAQGPSAGGLTLPPSSGQAITTRLENLFRDEGSKLGEIGDPIFTVDPSVGAAEAIRGLSDTEMARFIEGAAATKAGPFAAARLGRNIAGIEKERRALEKTERAATMATATGTTRGTTTGGSGTGTRPNPATQLGLEPTEILPPAPGEEAAAQVERAEVEQVMAANPGMSALRAAEQIRKHQVQELEPEPGPGEMIAGARLMRGEGGVEELLLAREAQAAEEEAEARRAAFVADVEQMSGEQKRRRNALRFLSPRAADGQR